VPSQIVILSGPVGSGKSTLANALAAEYGIVHIKTHECLEMLKPGVLKERRTLQRLGESLDRKTGGSWVREALDKAIEARALPASSIVLVDAARIPGQIESMRQAYGRKVLHIHLTAPLPVLEQRYRDRKGGPIKELSSYKKVLESQTESKVDDLKHIADIVIDSKLNTRADVVTRAAAHIGLYGRDYPRLVDVLVGGEYGSEGKGQIAAYLASEYDYLVRVGGPNAGHTVYEEPKPYVYHQLPSGTRCSSAKLIIGSGAVLRVESLLKEISDCGVDYERLSIDPQAMIISDEDIKREGDLKAAIGSTGQGVGSATARKIMGRSDKNLLLAKHTSELKPFLRDTCSLLERAYRESKRILLEGTQGTGLSLHHGPYPHVTSRDTTVAGCLAEAGISPSRVRKVVLVCRTYPIRVESPNTGDSGPMSQEITWEEVSRRSGVPLDELKVRELTSTTRKKRRVSEFDWCLLRKAASLNAPTDIALTFLDYLGIEHRKARRFDQLDQKAINFIEEVERVAAAPVSLISTRFHSRSIIDRRTW
jgi:adenylosuccinate synthase